VTELAILIVSHNTRRDLEICLESLTNRPPATAHEVVVIDNASTDGSAELVRTRWPHVRLIELGANVGFARANNIGFRDSRSDLVLLLNSDTIVPPGAVDRLVAELRRVPEAAIVGPRLVGGHGRPEISFGRMISPWVELKQKVLVRLLERRFPPVSRWVRAQTSRAQTVDWVSGACLLVTRTDAEAAGLLDERFFMYCEDVDFCAAVRSLGRQVRFTPAVSIVHLRGRSVAAAPAATEAAYRRSQLAFYEKHAAGWVPWLRAYLWLRGKLPRPSADI
jgi:GT2 family glycosyltransferase